MDAAEHGRTSLVIRSNLASAAAHNGVSVQTDAAAIVDALDGLRLAVLAASSAPDPGPDDPGQWMRVELFGHQVVYGLAREVVWAGRRWLEVSWPAYAVGGTEAEAGSKRYHPNAVYASEVIGEEAVMKNLTSFLF